MNVAGLVDLRQLVHVLPDAVVALELAHAKVMRMHVLPGGDIGLGKTDDLVVAANRVARLSDRAQPSCGPAGSCRAPSGYAQLSSMTMPNCTGPMPI
jgi:hypothetical protein